MPRLKKYTDGRGYYLTGHFPGIGFCTWQIGKDGLLYLAKRGISSSGDSLRLQDLRDLLERKLVGTAASGTTPTSALPPPSWVKPLAEALIGWSLVGGVDALSVILCPGKGATTDARPRCYSTAFLSWIDGLDHDTGLVRFAGISAAEFEDLVANGGRGFDEEDPLICHLMERGAVGVLWRLSRLAGAVAVRLRTGAECPEEWQTDLMLSWLFARIKEFEGRRRKANVSTGPRCPVVWNRPRIVWAVDLQEVTTLLPSQLLPQGVNRVEWKVNQGKPVYPLVSPGVRGRSIEESESEPLRPLDVYTVELTPSGGDAGPTRWTIICPSDPPFILFHTDGSLVDVEDPDPLPPGRYLALVRPGQEPAARAIPGFGLCERIPVSPVGWNGWTGWITELSPAVLLPGYTVAGPEQAVCWDIEPLPDYGVSWLETCPVSIGSLPRICLQTSAAYQGAVLEVTVEGAGRLAGEPIYLTLGKDILIQGSGSQAVVDLNTAPQLKNRFGRFRLKCQPAGRLDQPPLVLVFSRLPSMSLKYVPDPARSSVSTALQIDADAALAGVIPGQDTEILTQKVGPGQNRFVIRSTRPELAPGVHLRSQQADWEMRVRIGVTRAAMISEQAGFEGWRQLPIEGIELSEVRNGDRLRIQFHIPPITEGGRLISRLPDQGELFVGEPQDRSTSPAVYEVPLHRWRDGFGIGASGVIQVRGATGWLDVARLTSSSPLGGGRQVIPETQWQQLTFDLEQAVARGEQQSANELIARCLEAADNPESAVCASELLPLAAAHAALVVCPPTKWSQVRTALERLKEREDLPDAKLLAVSLAIRSGERRGSDGEWSLARVEEIGASLPTSSRACVVRAECWYRLARSAGGPAPGCWRSCMDCCDRYLQAGLPETGLAFSDALLLWELARVMLGYPPVARSAPTGLLPSHRGWVGAVRFTARFLREPWHGRANPEVHQELSESAPSVLCPQDEALVRFVLGIATGRGEPERYWPVVTGLQDGSFYALPLLRARYARYASDPTAGEEYNQAWVAFLSGDNADLLDVIAAERP